MDDIEKFFTDINFELETVHIERGFNDGRLRPVVQAFDDKYREREVGDTTEYAYKYEDEERNRLRQRFNDHNRYSDPNRPDLEFYRKYNFFMNIPESPYRNRKLPIFYQKDEILDTINKYPVIILEGPTGCGKTTQVPQFIFDDAMQHKRRCNIVIVQPRRVAAQSNANRVSAERGWPRGSLVGYQIGLDERVNRGDATRILFCTTGVLLEQLVRSAKSKNPLNNYTHIILDEVHERDKNMDFLFIVIKKLIDPTVKIILMSATIDSAHFAQYFSMPFEGRFRPAPIIRVAKKALHQIQTFYLDDLEAAIKKQINPNYHRPYIFDIKTPRVHDEIYLWALKLCVLFERMDRIENDLSDAPNPNYDTGPKPTILIFLPGINEINSMHRHLEEWKLLNQETSIARIIMHSTISKEQIECALQTTSDNVRKIILATNVAESSITVPDVKYIIDFCVTRNLINDSKTNFTTLRLDWASHTNCDQRRGRTGRVMDGRCYRLVPREFYQNTMLQTTRPELVTSPLENMILKSKLLDMGAPEEILALAMDKPKLEDVANTILQLKEIGGLFRTVNNRLADMDGDITFMGRIMCDLPLDVRLTKLIIFGYCFSVLKECIIIASALNCTHGIFRQSHRGPSNSINFYRQILQWSNGSGSDLFAMLHVYNVWEGKCKYKAFGTSVTKEEYKRMRDNERAWCEKHSLNFNGLMECRSYIKEISERLLRKGIKSGGGNLVQWKNNEKAIIIKVVISGAFYPHYFKRHSNEERNAFQDINGLDPRNTVYFKKFSHSYNRCFYVQNIKRLFVEYKIVDHEDLVDVKITFADGAEKAFVTFKNNEELRPDEYGFATLPGKIKPEVYKAVKACQLKLPFKIKVIDTLKDQLIVERYYERHRMNLVANEDGTYSLKSYIRNGDDVCIPRLLEDFVEGVITHIDNCGRFWFQPSYMGGKVGEIFAELNEDRTLDQFDDPSNISVGQVLAAPYYDNGVLDYYRANVLKIIKDKGSQTYKVQFIDFGNTHTCCFTELRKLAGVSAKYIDVPPLCFECCLTEVQPNVLDSAHGAWSSKANQWFKNETDGKTLKAEIYSVVNGIASVRLIYENGNVNEELRQKAFASYCEESYASKANHAQRLYAKRAPRARDIMDAELAKYLKNEFLPEIEPPAEKLCRETIELKGPISPIDTTISALIEEGIYRETSIDPASVNSVILNNDPQEHTDKYMVAASVLQKEGSPNLMARYTTLMPSIRGFGQLMTLIFCPTMEIKRDNDKCRYKSIIAGLGFDYKKKHACFSEHDMRIDLDVQITPDDIRTINVIRHCMDSLLFTDRGQLLADSFSKGTKDGLAVRIKELIVELLEKPRKSVELGNVSKIEWGEHKQYQSDIVEPPDDIDRTYGHRSIFPLHQTLKLKPLHSDVRNQLQENCKNLHNHKDLSTSLAKPMKCKLCCEDLTTIANIRDHLISRLHMDRERDVDFDYDELL